MQAALTWAQEHLFDRKSVVLEFELWRHALEHSRGQPISLTELKAASGQAGDIDEKNPSKVTIKQALEREWRIVFMTKDCLGRFGPLAPTHLFANERLGEDQQLAVEHILKSRDFIILFRGGAGAGKSQALMEVHQGLQCARRSVCVIAPHRASGQQGIDLKWDGSRMQPGVSTLDF